MELPAASSNPPKNKVSFADFELDLSSGELVRNNRNLRLAAQPARVLCLLVRRAGEIVSRADLQTAIWDRNTFVDFEQGLNWCIRQLRAVLEDDAANPQFIETVPKRGYRFLAECKTNELDSSANVSRRVLGSRFAVIAAVCFLMGGLTALLWAHRPKTPTATVLVLPVDNFTGDEKNESMTDGITDEMIAGLGSAKPAELKVIDRLTAAKFKRSQECILHIGKQLHADFVLVSSLVPSARGPRLSAGLFRVTDNTQVWSTDAYGLPAVNTSSGNVASQIASLLLHR